MYTVYAVHKHKHKRKPMWSQVSSEISYVKKKNALINMYILLYFRNPKTTHTLSFDSICAAPTNAKHVGNNV